MFIFFEHIKIKAYLTCKHLYVLTWLESDTIKAPFKFGSPTCLGWIIVGTLLQACTMVYLGWLEHGEVHGTLEEKIACTCSICDWDIIAHHKIVFVAFFCLLLKWLYSTLDFWSIWQLDSQVKFKFLTNQNQIWLWIWYQNNELLMPVCILICVI